MSAEAIERLAFVEVRTRIGQEGKADPWKPLSKNGVELPTFWDTRMGNFDCRGFGIQNCATCATLTANANNTTAEGERPDKRFGNERCQGHFGIVRMPRLFPHDPNRQNERFVVYNPHLFSELEHLLQAECFFCHHFRCLPFDVARFKCALDLVDAGLVGEALHLLDAVPNSRGIEAKQKRLRDPTSVVINDVATLENHVDRILRTAFGGHVDKQSEVRGLHDVRQDITKQAMRELREMGVGCPCTHCGGISPRVTTKHFQFYYHFGKKSYVEHNVEFAKVLTRQEAQRMEEENKIHNRQRTYLSSNDAREHVRALLQNEKDLIGRLFPSIGVPTIPTVADGPVRPAGSLVDDATDVFFIQALLVPPLPLRMSSGFKVQDGGAITPDDKSKALSDVLDFVEQVEAYQTLLHCNTEGGSKKKSRKKKNSSGEDAAVEGAADGLAQEPVSSLTQSQIVNHERNLRNMQLRVNQAFDAIMESFAKKEGLFRMNMMGKRVNQACRSVISPDYLVEPNEVLLPRPFARNLSFPEKVSFFSPARTAFLKQCVVNGPHKYPGASNIEVRQPSGDVTVIDLRGPEASRRQHAEKYFSLARSNVIVTVYRHVVSGDRLVFNRQPTLHKPSMMSYRAKVLSGMKTLRFHYINSKSYNADFDGDEMNVHVPQTLEARAELECIMDANLNFLVPTSGKPIRGLIQDHVVAGVLLTSRDLFMDRERFVQLLYFALFPYLQSSVQNVSGMIPLPAILLPRPRWTGKQLVSAILKFVCGMFDRRSQGVTLKGVSMIQQNAYKSYARGKIPTDQKQGDHRVIILNGELITGSICKNQLGPSNMAVSHVIHEVHGPHAVGQLFGALGRALTQFLQREGFSLAADDMALADEATRQKMLHQLDNAPMELESEADQVGAVQDRATNLQKTFVPGKMLVPFPENQLLMMTVSGAKGSNTNTIQMGLVLGQQMFDGQRVKPMNSGKTLPVHFPGEKRARSFGYAMGSFATGIRPGEYTIHAMAGRDGLIDTAVKTSRSGHLQRCLIKGLESLTVRWDETVRDSNGSVVQFRYGGDGLDPCRASTLHNWEMVKDNQVDLGKRFHVQGSGIEDDAAELPQRNSTGKRPSACMSVPNVEQEKLKERVQATSVANPLPKAMTSSLLEYVKKSVDCVQETKVSHFNKWCKAGVAKDKMTSKREAWRTFYAEKIGEITAKKRLRSFCDEGDPVGLLAAQAAGEPSTQMTLNTFHSAGATVSHVTEGIPRLRELLIHASVQNPAVVIPVLKATPQDEEVIRSIIGIGMAVKLESCLAQGVESTRFHVVRSPGSTVITIALLFSNGLLEECRGRMRMSPGEHAESFVTALTTFSKRLINTLRGRTRSGAGAPGESSNGVNAPVEDPAALDDPAAPDADDIDGYSLNNSDDDDDEFGERKSHATGGGQTPAIAPKKHLGPIVTSSDDEDDLDEEDEDAAAKESEDDADEPVTLLPPTLRAAVGGKRGGPQTFTVTTFPKSVSVFGSGKYTVEMQPVSQIVPSTGAPSADYFAVQLVITGPPNVIAVIPDAIRSHLQTVLLPTWIPQFDNIMFVRTLGDQQSGEIVFRGPNATLSRAMNLVSMFSVFATPAIQLERAVSTDIRDLANTFGVENGYQGLVDELNKLFKRYAVDHRHLSLIADASMHRGIWENYNFTGVISRSSSPLFQMTFASAKRFLHSAVTRGVSDDLRSVSSCIMVGEKPRVGTANVHLYSLPSVVGDIVERYPR